jgi:hypothetical protein
MQQERNGQPLLEKELRARKSFSLKFAFVPPLIVPAENPSVDETRDASAISLFLCLCMFFQASKQASKQASNFQEISTHQSYISSVWFCARVTV